MTSTTSVVEEVGDIAESLLREAPSQRVDQQSKLFVTRTQLESWQYKLEKNHFWKARSWETLSRGFWGGTREAIFVIVEKGRQRLGEASGEAPGKLLPSLLKRSAALWGGFGEAPGWCLVWGVTISPELLWYAK